MKKISQLAAMLSVLVAPLLAAAAQIPTGINLAPILPYKNGILNIVNGILVPVLMAISFIVFLWGVYKYFIQGAADEKSRTDGRQFTLWGIIGFVIIVSLWGLVNLLMSTLGLSAGTNAPPPPTFQGVSGTSGVNTTGNSGYFPNAGQVGGGGGGGSGSTASTQSYAQGQYDLCRGYNDSVATCLQAYMAAGGTGTPVESGGSSGSGGSIPEGGDCSSNYEGCSPSAPYCISGVCSTGVSSSGGSIPEGGDCSSNYEGCSSSAPYCISGVCSTGVSAGSASADETDPCYDIDGNYLC